MRYVDALRHVETHPACTPGDLRRAHVVPFGYEWDAITYWHEHGLARHERDGNGTWRLYHNKEEV